jgi:hypothetical protein
MRLPVAASVAIAPLYGGLRAIHHGLRGTDMQDSVGQVLDSVERWFLHPRVYAARRRNTWLT